MINYLWLFSNYFFFISAVYFILFSHLNNCNHCSFSFLNYIAMKYILSPKLAFLLISLFIIYLSRWWYITKIKYPEELIVTVLYWLSENVIFVTFVYDARLSFCVSLTFIKLYKEFSFLFERNVFSFFIVVKSCNWRLFTLTKLVDFKPYILFKV